MLLKPKRQKVQAALHSGYQALPIFTGSIACVHVGSSSPKCGLVMPLRVNFRSSSYSCNTGERKQDTILRLYRSLGRVKEFFRRLEKGVMWRKAGRKLSLSPNLISMVDLVASVIMTEWSLCSSFLILHASTMIHHLHHT